MKNLEKILEHYRKEAFDPAQPFLQAVFHLSKTYGNDYTLGSKVRELISRFEEADRERVQIELDKQLQQILTNGKN
jgi:hypothetical protein